MESGGPEWPGRRLTDARDGWVSWFVPLIPNELVSGNREISGCPGLYAVSWIRETDGRPGSQFSLACPRKVGAPVVWSPSSRLPGSRFPVPGSRFSVRSSHPILHLHTQTGEVAAWETHSL